MNSYYEKIGNETHCIDEEIPFEVPESWEWCRLGNIGNWGAGATPLRANKDYYIGGNILWLKTGELNNSYVYDTEEKITPKALHECSLKINKMGDVLIAMYGATIGKLAIVGCELTTNQACCGCTPFNGINNLFLFYFLQASKMALISQGEGGAQPNISREKIVKFLIAFPSEAEQNRIVKQIQVIDDFIQKYDKLEQQETQLQLEFPGKLKKSILQSAIQGKLVVQNPDDEPASVLLDKIRKEKEQLVKAGKIKKDKNESVIYKNTDDNSYYESRNGKVLCIDDEIPFEIPNSWEWVRLGSIAQHNTGKTLDKGRNKGILHKYITTSNLYWGYFDLSELREMPFEIEELDRCTASKGDLLICEGGEAGRSAIWYSENSICFQNHIHRVRSYANINSEYLLYYMEKIYRTGEINIYRKGVGIQSLSGNSLASILIPLPPINEQNRIAEKIRLLFTMLS